MVITPQEARNTTQKEKDLVSRLEKEIDEALQMQFMSGPYASWEPPRGTPQRVIQHLKGLYEQAGWSVKYIDDQREQTTYLNFFPLMKKTTRMLLGIAIGDAFGAGYEFSYDTREEFAEALDLTKYKKRFDTSHKPGMYTDDTQMSIAVAEALLETDKFDFYELADKFVGCFRRDSSIGGYSRRIYGNLVGSVSGREFYLKNIPGSWGNGAAMRSVPIGVIKDLKTLLMSATINARITHCSDVGVDSSKAVALLSHMQFYNIQEDMLAFIQPHVEAESFEVLKSFKEFGESEDVVPVHGLWTVAGVIYLLGKYDKPLDVLKGAIELGGDTDTTASIALGISAINNGLDMLPKFMLRELTNHRYGRDYLIQLGDKLAEKYQLE